MAHKLRCYLCSEIHKARIDKFPIIIYGYAEVLEGEGEEAKLITKEIELGHVCKKCQRKAAIKKFVKDHKVKQDPGQRLQDAINIKFSKIKQYRGK